MWVAPKSWVSSDIIADPAAELNRLEGNCKAIYDLLTPYTIIGAQTHKTDWAAATEITLASMQNIEDNIRAFYDMYALAFTASVWSGIVVADYQLLSYWETKLAAMYVQASALAATIRLCGSFNCGE